MKKGSDNKTQRVKLTQNGPPYLSVEKKIKVDSKRKDIEQSNIFSENIIIRST